MINSKESLIEFIILTASNNILFLFFFFLQNSNISQVNCIHIISTLRWKFNQESVHSSINVLKNQQHNITDCIVILLKNKFKDFIMYFLVTANVINAYFGILTAQTTPDKFIVWYY